MRPWKRALYAVAESGSPTRQMWPSSEASRSTLCRPGLTMAEDEAVAVEGILTPTRAVMEPKEDRAYGEHEDGAEVEVEEIGVAVPEVPEDRVHGEHEEDEEDEAEAAVVRTAAATCCREEMSRPLRTRIHQIGKEKWLRMTVPRRQKRSNS
jgi:hypothetical protein